MNFGTIFYVHGVKYYLYEILDVLLA